MGRIGKKLKTKRLKQALRDIARNRLMNSPSENTVSPIELSYEVFQNSGWETAIASVGNPGYNDLALEFHKLSKQKESEGNLKEAHVLDFLHEIYFMIMQAHSPNLPYRPRFNESKSLDNISQDELVFLDSIVNQVSDFYLKARISDLLWLCKPNKEVKDAWKVIDSIASISITKDNWFADMSQCIERAARLCLQLRDRNRLGKVETKLHDAFKEDYKDSHFIPLKVAELILELGLLKTQLESVAIRCRKLADKHQEQNNFNGTQQYLELTGKIYLKLENENGWLETLRDYANSFELEGDHKLNEDPNSFMIANMLYEKAILAYRKIPNAHRAKYDVEVITIRLHQKLSETGVAIVENMPTYQGLPIPIGDIQQAAVTHVKGKESLSEALIDFCGFKVPNFNSLEERANESIRQFFLSNLFSQTHYAADGRVERKIPAIGWNQFENNYATVEKEMISHFNMEIALLVNGSVLPALNQILLEYRVCLPILISLCQQSPFVQDGRERLVANALWMGFEQDFSIAIHLICPQLENILRNELKGINIKTTTLDDNGIEKEVGLSSLLEKDEVKELFGVSYIFELKTIFANVLGGNLRNNVAHGLLSDIEGFSVASVYGWWMFLRLILHSTVYGKINTRLSENPFYKEHRDKVYFHLETFVKGNNENARLTDIQDILRNKLFISEEIIDEIMNQVTADDIDIEIIKKEIDEHIYNRLTNFRRY